MINRIEKRAIEAMAIQPFIAAVGERVGEKTALEILIQVNEKEAYHRGEQMAQTMGENNIDALETEVASWGEGGVWEMEVLEKSSSNYFFNVLRCPYYDKYKELGLESYGVAFSCCRDEPFARGFNPHLRLERTKTIMEGDDHCDFRYYLDESE